jgi:hypothetical protein
LNQVLEIRAKILMKNADLINLGLAGFVVLMPRITEFLDRKKKNKDTQQTEALSQESPLILIKTSEETAKEEAMKRYQEQQLHGKK